MKYYSEARKAEALIREAFDKFGIYNVKLRVSFNGRFTSRMGDALLRGDDARIRLSRPLWPLASEKQRRNTILHEAAHIIANYIHKDNCKHDYRWKEVMITLGLAPKRCHNVDNSSVKRKKQNHYFIQCPSCKKQMRVTQNLLTRMRKHQQRRCCVSCRSAFSFAMIQDSMHLAT